MVIRVLEIPSVPATSGSLISRSGLNHAASAAATTTSTIMAGTATRSARTQPLCRAALRIARSKSARFAPVQPSDRCGVVPGNGVNRFILKPLVGAEHAPVRYADPDAMPYGFSRGQNVAKMCPRYADGTAPPPGAGFRRSLTNARRYPRPPSRRDQGAPDRAETQNRRRPAPRGPHAPTAGRAAP